MPPETPPRVLDYRKPEGAGPERRFRRADGCLLGAFAFYAAMNLWLVTSAEWSPFGVLFAFAVPLPVMFCVVALFAHFLSSPPAFSRAMLLAVLLLVIAQAIVNVYVGMEMAAGV